MDGGDEAERDLWNHDTGECEMSEETMDGPVELGAEMDYAEHERTYSGFLALFKWGSLGCAALLISMAFGFFTSAGFISASVLFVLICVVAFFLMR